ncbi:MAG: L,D-transpeptidase family protein [Steroidobacteraceae bacterium]
MTQLVLLCAWLLAFSWPAAAQEPVAGGVPAAIATRLSDLATAAQPRVEGQELAAFMVLRSFYTQRGFEPAWSDPARAQVLLGALRDSADEGLTPGDYHFTELVRQSLALARPDATDYQRANFDLLMTDAAIRLGYHLWFGKVDPVSFDPAWNMARRIPGFDPVAELSRVLATPDLAAAIRDLAPQLPLYAGLRRELMRHNTLALRGGWETVPAGSALRPGERDARVPALRRRLVITGELSAEAEAGTDPASAEVYDPALEQAVREFQRRMGLTADGVLGRGTLAELNVPVEDRIRQLRVNLDRGRVLLHDLPPEFVVVNIASQEVYLMRQNQVVWSSRAQVGREYRQTPEYRSEVDYLVFNPTWTVPPGIVRNDILPAARRDPASILRKGLKVLDAAGHELPPASIDWKRFTSGYIPYTLRQDPGPDNALGRVKFMFPNPYAVYLHDTPSKSLFAKDERLTSSGCVRIERPLELAELLLADPQKWSRERIDEVVQGGRLQNVTLARKVPILLVYWTAWIDSQGALNLRPDPYGRDAKWARALDAPFRFRKEPLARV